LIQFLKENPLLTIVTTISAVLTALNTFIGAFGLPPFWADVFVSTMLAYSAIYWCLHTWRDTKRKRRIIGLAPGPKDGSGSLTKLLKPIGISALIPITLIALFAWNAALPILHLRETQWVLCGTFVSTCTSNSCIELYGMRNRKITNRCYYFDDDSGYLYLKSPNWWTYKPESVSSRCDGKTSGSDLLDQAMFDSSCEGIFKVR
jgi:hypothetical protein